MTTAESLASLQAMLRDLNGQSVIGLKRFCGTWHFYFGEAHQEVSDSHPTYLGVECPWRLLSGGTILWGSDDDAEDPSVAGVTVGWNKTRILNFIAEIGGGTWDPRDLEIRSFTCGAHGELRIEFIGRLSIETFTAGAREMEWIVRLRKRSVVWMNGCANLVEEPKSPLEEDGDNLP